MVDGLLSNAEEVLHLESKTERMLFCVAGAASPVFHDSRLDDMGV